MTRLPNSGFTKAELDELTEVLDDLHNSAIAAGMDCDVEGTDYQRWEAEVVERLIGIHHL